MWLVPNIPGMPKFTNDDILSKAPSLGQHSKEILKSLGYKDLQIDNLIKDEVIK